MTKKSKDNPTLLPIPSKEDHEKIDPYFYYLDYATGGVLPSMYAFGGNLSSSGSDQNNEPKKETDSGTNTVWQGVRTGVAAVNPIAGIIHGAAGLGESAMANVDPDKTRGANMAKATWDPFSAQLGVWGHKDASVGERVLAGLVPLSAGLINTKYDKEHAAQFRKDNQTPVVQQPQEFQNTMYGKGGPLPTKPEAKSADDDELKKYYDTLNKYNVIDPLNTKDANDVKNYIGKDIAPKIKEYQKDLNTALRNKYKLTADAPITNQYLTPEEADKAVSGKYSDYMNYFKAYQDYRKKTPVMPARSVEGTVTEDDNIYGQRHVNLFQSYNVQKGRGGYLPEMFGEGGPIKKPIIQKPKPQLDSIAITRQNAVWGLQDQNIVDTSQVLDYLNYDDNKKLIGDFTIDEVKKYMQSYKSKKASGGHLNNEQSDIVDINGPKHTQGGIPMGPNAEVEGGEVKVGDYIFSDQLKYSGNKTFADQAKTIRKRFEERKSDEPAMKTQMVQLEQLRSLNESARQEKEKQESYMNDLIEADAKAYGGYVKLGREGEVEIDPSMRKIFTKTAKARGMNTSEYATKLYAYGGKLKKMAGGGDYNDPTSDNYDPFKDDADNYLGNILDKSMKDMNTSKDTKPKFGNEELGLASSLLPAMQNLAYSLKKPEQTKFERVHPELISLAPERDLASKETNRARTIAREDIRGNSNTSGQILSNLAANNSALTENLMDKYSQSHMNEANANAQIRNNAAAANTTIGNQEIIANEQNRAMQRSAGNRALADIGTNTQGYLRDKKLSAQNEIQNKRTMDIINGMFPSYRWGEDPNRDNQMIIAFKQQ